MINYKKLIKISNSTNIGLKNIFTHKSILKNRKCGDQIHVEIIIKNHIFKDIRFESQSCILCQASASILSREVKNQNCLKFSSYKKNFKKKLSGAQKKNIMYKKFAIFFDPIYKIRKHCILLPFDAIEKAIKK